MKRKNRSKGDILIDLTSLLDVIFIILLVVICNQRTLVDRLEQQNKEVADVKSEAEASKYLYDEQIEMANSYNIYISVYSNFDENNPVSREIHVLKNGENIQDFELNGNNVQEALDEFEAYLMGIISENPNKPVVLSLNENDDTILYRDEKAIKGIYDKLKAEYADVYLK